MIRAAVLAFVFMIAVLAGCGARGETPESPWHGTDGAGEQTVRLYVFWSATCPHCQKALPFVRSLADEFPWVEVRSLPLTDHPDNVEVFLLMSEQLGSPVRGVPTFMVCGRARVGFASAETTGAEIRDLLVQCRRRLAGEATVPAAQLSPAAIEVPLLGSVDPATVSLPLFTVLIAGLDAFNPCAFFVLMFLLSLLVHARDRIRMAVIGGIFVLASGVLYFAFMAAWLNVFLLVGELAWVTTVAALIAVGLAILNIKDYFWFRKGVSLSIPEHAKPGLFARMRNVTVADRWPALVLGAVTLAVAANTYELLCTAGFPMLYTRVLTLHALPSIEYYLYLGFYNVVYVVPLLGIATVFVVTLGSRKLQEGEGRALKLLSGLMMLALGITLFFAPDWLGDIRIAAGILVLAVALTAVTATLTRVFRRS